jgi:hypothetical protein
MNKLFLLLSFFILAKVNAKHGNPTYATDVAKIIYTKCSNCHSPGNIAPFPLVNFNQVLDNRFAIHNSVQKGSMPPWLADNTYQSYAHNKSLTEDEKDKIIDWVNNGAPRGDVNLEPPSPNFSNTGTLINPDQVFTIPTYTLNTSIDEYRSFVIPINNSEAKFIKSIEFLPANKNVVHHILLFTDSTNSCKLLDDADPLPGYQSFGGVGSNKAVLTQLWAPGGTAYYYPTGLGNRIPANSYFVLQVHFAPGFKGEKDSSQFVINWSKDLNVRSTNLNPILNHSATLLNGPLEIPADSIKTFYSKFKTPFDISLLGVLPHMHLIGKKIKAYGVTLLGDTINLIKIDNWDFHWQANYSFKKILKISAGTTFYGEAVYDNTVNNPFNPNNPPKLVVRGEGTADEMMLIYFNYIRYKAGDENISQEDSIKTSIIEKSFSNEVIIFPIPANNEINIQTESEILRIKLLDINGRVILNNGTNKILNTNEIANGIYLLELNFEKGKFVKKVIINKN